MKTGIVRSILRRFGYVKRSNPGFQAAAISRLFNNWTTQALSADAAIWKDKKALTARARDLERNNDYVRKFLSDLEKNVIGANGIGLQNKAKEFDGSPDKMANDKVELGWWEWGKRENCSTSGKAGWHKVCRLVLRSVARDGECLIRKVPWKKNGFGFALQLIETDLLDVDYNQPLQNGTKITMGVEVNEWDEVLAYHLLQGHPGDVYGGALNGYRRTRIPADEIIHLYMPDRIGQSRGFPWLVSAMLRLSQLGDYELAELVAARLGACKAGFFEQQTPDGWAGEDNGSGGIIDEAEPGQFTLLPQGTKYVPHDPTHPTTAYGDFRKGCLRGIACGLGVSYAALANDLEAANYSSMRSGSLDEREMWKMVQTWFIDEFVSEVFKPWLRQAMLSGKVNLPLSKFDKFNQPDWKPRRWAWVDPMKDIQASILEIDNGLKSRRSIIAENGGDIEETFSDIKADDELADEYDLEFGDKKEASAFAEADAENPVPVVTKPGKVATED